MAIRRRTNQYRGINAHLHSQLQHEHAGWEVFHNAHITHLAEAIDTLLPEGYLIDPQKSMQIRAIDTDGESETRLPGRKPDAVIYQFDSQATPLPSTQASTPMLTLPALSAVEPNDEGYLAALAIREILSGGELGEPITWIELLSPTNKPPHPGFLQYREKRNTALAKGLAFVEFDYLHETRPTLRSLPSYPDGHPDAYPYYILVTDPHPSLDEGELVVYGIGVDEPLPQVRIPLRGDGVTLDCGAVYNRTFASLGSYSYRVDYAAEPVNFEAYISEDQQRIRARMASVISN